MAKKLPAGLLKGAQRVKVFSSGLDVWLYDPSFREALKASRAFEPRAGEALRRKAMQRFVQEGKLLSYGLMQDDSIDVAVAARAPRASLALHPEDAAALGLAPGEMAELALGGTPVRLPVAPDPTLPRGTAGAPAGRPGLAGLALPAWCGIRKVAAP